MTLKSVGEGAPEVQGEAERVELRAGFEVFMKESTRVGRGVKEKFALNMIKGRSDCPSGECPYTPRMIAQAGQDEWAKERSVEMCWGMLSLFMSAGKE